MCHYSAPPMVEEAKLEAVLKRLKKITSSIECLEQMIIVDNQSPSARWLVDWCQEQLEVAKLNKENDNAEEK